MTKTNRLGARHKPGIVVCPRSTTPKTSITCSRRNFMGPEANSTIGQLPHLTSRLRTSPSNCRPPSSWHGCFHPPHRSLEDATLPLGHPKSTFAAASGNGPVYWSQIERISLLYSWVVFALALCSTTFELSRFFFQDLPWLILYLF